MWKKSVGEDMQQSELSYAATGSVYWYSHSGHGLAVSLISKLRYKYSLASKMPPLDIYSTEHVHVYWNIYTGMLIAVLFIKFLRLEATQILIKSE